MPRNDFTALIRDVNTATVRAINTAIKEGRSLLAVCRKDGQRLTGPITAARSTAGLIEVRLLLPRRPGRLRRAMWVELASYHVQEDTSV